MCQICRIKSGKFITPFTDSQQASNHWMQNLDFNCTTISVSKTNRSADHTDCTLEQQRHESSSYHQYNSHQLKSICMQTSFKCSTEEWADASPYTRGDNLKRSDTHWQSYSHQRNKCYNMCPWKNCPSHVFHFHLNHIKPVIM